MADIRNPRYINSDGTAIDLEYNHPQYGWIPFTATPTDVEPLGRTLYAMAVSGKAGPVSVYEGPTLEKVKADKLEEINIAADKAINRGFKFQKNVYDSDSTARQNITGIVSAINSGLQLPVGFTWRTQDNQNIPMDTEDVVDLGNALLQHVQAQYSKSWSLKDSVANATTREEVAAIVWE